MSFHSRQDGAEDGDVDSGTGGWRFKPALYSMFLFLQVHRWRSGGWKCRVWRRGDCRLGSTKVHFMCGVLSNVVIHDAGLLL